MTDEEIQAVIDRALPMRPPRFEADVSPRTKIGELENYMLDSAFMHAELEEALHWLNKVIESCRDQIETMTGYEACLPPKPQGRITRDDVLKAKRLTMPEPFLAGAAARSLRETVLRQIARFEFEKDVVSRAYTLISGG